MQTDRAGAEFQVALSAVRRLLWKAAFASCFVNILMLTGPLYMLQVYDRVLSSRSVETLAVITMLILFLFAAMAALDFARGALLSRAGADLEKRLNQTIFNLSMDAARGGAEGADQPLKDLRQLRQFLGGPGLTAVFDAPWTPIFLAVIFLMHWLLGVVAVLGMIVLLGLAFVNERVSRKSTLSSQKLMAQADRAAASAMRNVSATDAMGMRRTMMGRWLQIGADAGARSTSASDAIGGLTAVSKSTRLFLQSAILGTGALLAINGAVTPGVMIAASIIAGRALSPIEIATGQWKSFTYARDAYARLKEMLAVREAPAAKTDLPPPKGALAVERLYCRPGRAKEPVIKGVSFALAPGEALGVIGPSAAGKSTLGRAIVGVETASSGNVRLDAARIDQWDAAALGKHVGYLPQDVELFSGTAAQNIARFYPEASSEDVIAAAQEAGAHEAILSLPDGYETEIGEGGHHISGGQRQRLGLARALFGAPTLVVLDEPNSNLDSEGEAALAGAVQRLKERSATVIVITHRPSALAVVDKIMILADGEIKAIGPRDEILQKIAPGQVRPLRAAEPMAQSPAFRGDAR